MKIRQMLLVFNLVSIIAWFGLMFAFAFAYTIGHSTVKGNTWVLIPLFIILFFLVFYSTAINATVKDKIFYMKYDELIEAIEKQNDSWTKANKLIEILGQQQAIKLWNKEKEKENKID